MFKELKMNEMKGTILIIKSQHSRSTGGFGGGGGVKLAFNGEWGQPDGVGGPQKL